MYYLCSVNNKQLEPAATDKRHKIMKTYNNINEISDAEILAVLNKCMKNVEYDPEKEAKAKARRAKREVEDTIAFHICLQSIEKGLRK